MPIPQIFIVRQKYILHSQQKNKEKKAKSQKGRNKTVIIYKSLCTEKARESTQVNHENSMISSIQRYNIKVNIYTYINLRPDTIKLLEENIEHPDVNPSKIFFDPPPREMKIKTNKWDLIKLKSFCAAKETINKTKRQPLEWEKILVNKTTDKGLISKIYKQLMQLNNKKTKQTNEKNGWKT